jgi:tRNA (cytidine/uridine-2'-O-)-methyltransferase
MIHLIVYHPEIPQNVGNMVRTCAATGTKLHLIGPFPFVLSDDTLKRAGMDYMPLTEISIYSSYEDFEQRFPSVIPIYCLTRYGKHTPLDIRAEDLPYDVALMVGSESTGIPRAILAQYPDHTIRLPMKPFARSLNVANTAAILVYEFLRLKRYEGLATQEVLKGSDYEGNE